MNQPLTSGDKRFAAVVGRDLGNGRPGGFEDLDSAPALDRLCPAECEGGKHRDTVAAQIADLVSELNEKQMKFARYLVGSGFVNASRAAIEAGYAPRSAKVKASRLRVHPKVSRLIELLSEGEPIALGGSRRRGCEGAAGGVWPPEMKHVGRRVTADEIIAHMADMLRTSALDFFIVAEDGTVKPRKIGSVPRSALNAARRITVAPDGTVSVELYDKLKVLEKLTKHYGLFDPREPDPVSPGGEPRTPPGVQGHDAFVESWEHRLRRYGPELLEDVRRMIIHGR